MKNSSSVLYILFGALDVYANENTYHKLFLLYRQRVIENDFAVICVDSKNLSTDELIVHIISVLSPLKPTKLELNRFLKRFSYQKLNSSETLDYISLSLECEITEDEFHLGGNRTLFFFGYKSEIKVIYENAIKYRIVSSLKNNQIVLNKNIYN